MYLYIYLYASPTRKLSHMLGKQKIRSSNSGYPDLRRPPCPSRPAACGGVVPRANHTANAWGDSVSTPVERGVWSTKHEGFTNKNGGLTYAMMGIYQQNIWENNLGLWQIDPCLINGAEISKTLWFHHWDFPALHRSLSHTNLGVSTSAEVSIQLYRQILVNDVNIDSGFF